ncbi:MAG TPA: response regulator transcription factor [Anaeromyxobacteraceae bacterium]|nr:response regulator transcription factor [Anaeromyxobacteraceae bacterium]
METGRILLVEDDAAIREGVADGLAFEGYQAEGVSNGREALDWLEREGPPAVVVLDLLMPVMNGAQLLERLRADPRWAAVPAVLMSAAMPEAEALPRADAYLQKPFDLSELVAAVARWCPPGGGAPAPGAPTGGAAAPS